MPVAEPFFKYLKNSTDVSTYFEMAVAGSRVALAAAGSKRERRDVPAIKPASVIETCALPRRVMNHPAFEARSEVSAMPLTTVKWSCPKRSDGSADQASESAIRRGTSTLVDNGPLSLPLSYVSEVPTIYT